MHKKDRKSYLKIRILYWKILEQLRESQIITNKKNIDFYVNSIKIFNNLINLGFMILLQNIRIIYWIWLFQGNYTFSMSKDLNDLLHLLVGENFFYSRLSFRSEIYTKIGTVYCIKVFCQTKTILKHKKKIYV